MRLDPRTYDRALACVHCGLCLPACPTYTQTGHEADSPRGRIQLMRGLADGALDPTPGVVEHLDLCLDCRACETACPSGVVYHELIEETHERLASHYTGGRAMRWFFFHVLTHPTRFKAAMIFPKLLRKCGLDKLLPEAIARLQRMIPASSPLWPRRLPARITPAGKKTKTVAFFTGCVGSVLYDRVNRQSVELLSALGAEVRIPQPTCCGAIHQHNGDQDGARRLARRNIDALLGRPGEEPEAIACAIAGCGAMLRQYEFILRDDPDDASRAREAAARVRDISEVLLDLGLHRRTDLLKHRVDFVVAYHDACHLAHAQQVTLAPRVLLAAIPGINLVGLYEADMCCGAAGTYNLTQPEMAAQLADRKLAHFAASGAQLLAAGNVGCAMHLQGRALGQKQKFTVVHPVELLHQSVFG